MSLVALCYLPGDAQFEQTKRERQNEETSSSSVELSVSVAKGANPIAGTSSSGQDLSGGLVIESTGEYFPEPRASLCGRIFFTWMTPLMRLGFRRPLLNSDLWELSPNENTNVLVSKFQKQWLAECERAEAANKKAGVTTKSDTESMAKTYLVARLYTCSCYVCGHVDWSSM